MSSAKRKRKGERFGILLLDGSTIHPSSFSYSTREAAEEALLRWSFHEREQHPLYAIAVVPVYPAKYGKPTRTTRHAMAHAMAKMLRVLQADRALLAETLDRASKFAERSEDSWSDE